jgi:hypothetical protein
MNVHTKEEAEGHFGKQDHAPNLLGMVGRGKERLIFDRRYESGL